MSQEKCGATCSDGSECQNYPVDGADRCRHHGGKSTGPKTEEGKKQSRTNAVTHGLHQSRETFLEHGEEHWRDKYHAYFESLCTRYERRHGYLDYDVKDDLAELAFQRVKLDIAREYEKEHAVDETKPLTEKSPEEIAGQIMETEQLSKVETIQNDILRETRLTKKDMGLYDSPESQKADAMERTLSEVLSED